MIPREDPAALPTPEEWVAWFDQQTHAEKIKAADLVLRVSQDAYNCFAMNHEYRLAQCRG